MNEKFIEDVYYTMKGQSIPEYCIPGVENKFASDKPCQLWDKEAFDAYQRLCDRLGVMDEDDDVETIICAHMDMEKTLCLRMYEYGARFGNQK